jgi:pilus assembly protein CpaB
MKTKTIILMAVAIVCGLVASYMTSRVIADRQAPTEDEKVTILVAKKNLAMGLLLKEPENFFEEKQLTKGEEPKRAIKNFEDLKDRRLAKPLSAEQFVTAEDLHDQQTAGLPGQMRPGMRAVALKVNADTGVGGFVLPHNRVDIVSVSRRGDEVLSRIILQNILVLAVDQNSQRPEDKLATVSSTVTVEVTPAQAEKLALATEFGTLRLILRPFGDEEKVTTGGATPKNLNTTSDAHSDDQQVVFDQTVKEKKSVWGSKVPDLPQGSQVVTKVPVAPPVPKTHTMTIFNGEQITKAVFSLSDKDSEDNTKIERSHPDQSSATKTPGKSVPVAK